MCVCSLSALLHYGRVGLRLPDQAAGPRGLGGGKDHLPLQLHRQQVQPEVHDHGGHRLPGKESGEWRSVRLGARGEAGGGVLGFETCGTKWFGSDVRREGGRREDREELQSAPSAVGHSGTREVNRNVYVTLAFVFFRTLATACDQQTRTLRDKWANFFEKNKTTV